MRFNFTSIAFLALGVSLISFTAALAASLPRDFRPEYAYAFPSIVSASLFLSVFLLAIGIACLTGQAEFKLNGGKRKIASQYAAVAIAICVLVFSSFALRFALSTPTPLLAVTSKSMTPTLNVGDFLVIAKPQRIEAGDIIAFKRGNDVIVHRVYAIEVEGIRTKGDAYATPDPWVVGPEEVYGKVVAVVPLLGFAFMALSNPAGFTLVAILLALIPAMRSLTFRNQDENCPFTKRRCSFGGFNPKVCSVCLQARRLRK
jgi:signal peptidase I